MSSSLTLLPGGYTGPIAPGPMSMGLFLTPEAMMTYCRTRLTGLDDQVQTYFEKQQKSAKAQQALSDLQNSFQKQDNGSGHYSYDSSKLADLEKAWSDAGRDPAELDKLKAMLDGGGEYSDGVVSSDEFDDLGTDFKNLQSDLSTNSELDMISLQSLMSQRQTAIQLTTNLMNTMSETSKGIVANIK